MDVIKKNLWPFFSSTDKHIISHTNDNNYKDHQVTTLTTPTTKKNHDPYLKDYHHTP